MAKAIDDGAVNEVAEGSVAMTADDHEVGMMPSRT